ncbi:MAG: hypothetical protein WCK49_05315 [Myxococcaceae bacterium]
MRIDPSSQSQLTALSNPKTSVAGKQFQNILASKQSSAVSALKNDLKQVSIDLKSGKITGEQASKQFVDLVVQKRNELNLSPDSLKKIQSAVGDLVSQDPAFVSKLQNELKRI